MNSTPVNSSVPVDSLPDIFQSICTRLAEQTHYHGEGHNGKSEEENNEETMRDLEDTLECPICLEPAEKPPIYECPVGHLLCSDCFSRVSECPICGQALTDPGQARNTRAEILSNKLARLQNKAMGKSRRGRIEVKMAERSPGTFSLQEFM